MRIAFDLGACVGLKTEKYSKEYGLVVAVEPVIENYTELIKKIIDERLYNVVPVLGAVDGKTKRGEIFVDEDPIGHSLYKKKRFTKNTQKRPVMVFSWDDLVRFVGVDHVDFAKVDIEGSEVNMFEEMTKCFPSEVIVEEHSRNGLTTEKDVRKVLKDKGYDVAKEMPERHMISAKRNGQ
uniref:Putative methyltransferase n=1 Tax=viral metagenome TaxID=1070528 RepID=A0A6M3MDK1_9ZZZZ